MQLTWWKVPNFTSFYFAKLCNFTVSVNLACSLSQAKLLFPTRNASLHLNVYKSEIISRAVQAKSRRQVCWKEPVRMNSQKRTGDRNFKMNNHRKFLQNTSCNTRGGREVSILENKNRTWTKYRDTKKYVLVNI